MKDAMEIKIMGKTIDSSLILIILFALLACIIISILIAIVISEPFTLKIMSEKYPHRAVLKQPWNQSNLSFYIDTSGVPTEDIHIYTINAVIGFRWWERVGAERLGYQVNFSRVDKPERSNISINWHLKNYTTRENLKGHTFINTTNHTGDLTCDTYNPPFSRCNISIKLGLDDAQMQKVIKHEIGHTFTLEHSFNSMDYKVRIEYGIDYLTNPSDIMFDDVLIDDKIIVSDKLHNLIFIISFIVLFSLYLVYQLRRYKYR